MSKKRFTVITASTAIVVSMIAGSTLIAGAAERPAGEADTSVSSVSAAAPRTYSYDFDSTDQGWSAGFADYSPSNGDLELESGIASLPAGTGSGKGLHIQGVNRSDDLYMFLKRRLGPADGIVAGKRYTVRTSVTFWTNSSGDCLGVGGSPGSSVFLKAGASTAEPRVQLESDNHYRVTIDKGNQAQGGADATVLGNIANGLPCDGRRWAKVTRTSSSALTVQADPSGHLWLNVGSDSGFESLTELYYSTIQTTLTPV